MSDLRLWHYTCNHGADGIRADGFVKPSLHPILTVDTNLITLGWFTDMDACDMTALGLTSFTLQCDRTEHRFEVDPSGAVWWPVLRRDYLRGSARPAAARRAVETLESAHGVMPAHWWASRETLQVVRSEATR